MAKCRSEEWPRRKVEGEGDDAIGANHVVEGIHGVGHQDERGHKGGRGRW